MAGEKGSDGNGYVRWSQFHAELQGVEKRCRDDLRRHQEEAVRTVLTTYDTHAERHKEWEAHVASIRSDVDDVQSVIDQQRGAKALIFFLIGSNLAVIAGLVLLAVSLTSGGGA